MPEITDDLVNSVRDWLGEAGVRHFRGIRAGHGRIDAVWNEGGIPHMVHFREGMQVRNKLRDLTNGIWSAHEYDDNWVAVVERAIN